MTDHFEIEHSDVAIEAYVKKMQEHPLHLVPILDDEEAAIYHLDESIHEHSPHSEPIQEDVHRTVHVPDHEHKHLVGQEHSIQRKPTHIDHHDVDPVVANRVFYHALI